MSDDMMKAKQYHVNDFGPYKTAATHGNVSLLMDGDKILDTGELKTFLNALYITTGGKRYHDAFDSLLVEMQGDKQQIADLEAQLAESQRREELLRAVAVAAQVYVNENWDPHRTMTPESAEAKVIRLLSAAVEGGAMGEG